MGATVIYADSHTYEDGSRYEMVVTAVPQSDEYPEGIKYRFQYMSNNGQTRLRFDNFPSHPGVSRHHYHTADGVYDDIEYTRVTDHVRKFYERVDAVRGGEKS